MKYFHFILLFLSICSLSYSQDNITVDSLVYPWYSPSGNYIEFYSKNSVTNFFDALNNSKKNKVSIVQFGDSHIQSEIPTNETRILLQKKYGNGGRGIVFPYSTAKTYSSIHYSTKHQGNWIYAKSDKPSKDLPKGLMGISSKTNDTTASFNIVFNSKIPSNHTRINLYCETDSLSYDLIVETDGNSTTLDIYKNSENSGVVTFTLPSISNSITFKTLKTKKSQNQFIIHGFEIINPDDKGVIFYSSGVGGAKFNSLLNIENLSKELKFISPDLVILDFGTNDILYSDSLKSNLENDIKNVISLVRKSSPMISIILCSTQDLFYKQKNLESTEKYSILLKKIAKETETAYWDWYNISGGKGSLKDWLTSGIAKTDMIHLTNIGYRIKGKLLFDAIENTKNKIEKNPNQNELVIQRKQRTVSNPELNNTKVLTTLSQRELTKIDTDSKTKDSTNQIIKTEKQTSFEIIENNSIKTDSLISNQNTTLVNKPVDKKNENQVLTTKEIKIEKQNISIIKKETTFKNIKIEQLEDITDSTIAMLEKNNPKEKNTKEKIQKIESNNKKNNEKANEKLNNPVYKDTLALKIVKVKDTIINKPIVQPKTVVKKIKKEKIITYKVKEGDNLSFIAERYHISVSELKRYNGLRSDKLSIGQNLKIKK